LPLPPTTHPLPPEAHHGFAGFRAARGILGFSGVILGSSVHFLGLSLRAGGHPPARDRARWLAFWSRMTLRALRVRVRTEGMPPRRGLLVSNHLSYLDIVVLGSLEPMRFVAKADVRRWPVMGRLAIMGGTLFIDRTRRADVSRVNSELAQALGADVPVVLFPEGTSSDGRGVLPFRSSLLAPAAEAGAPVTPCHLSYELDDGSVADEVCYWRDMTFLPHFLNLTRKTTVRARVRFGAPVNTVPDRKALARALHAAVETLSRTAAPGG
jgi:1-acyl-sn-glycerol-3-phosphate acyltransferase